MKLSLRLKQLSELLVALVLPISATFFVAQSNYDQQPSAEGRLRGYQAPNMLYPGEWGTFPLYPGDNPPLYPGDEKWEGRYSYGLAADTVAMASDGATLYVSMNDLRSTDPNYGLQALRYDGATWGSTWLGANTVPQAIAVKGNDLYFGAKTLSLVSGTQVNYVAHKNDWQVDGMGGGLGGPEVEVKQIVILGNSACIGGTFSSAGGQPAGNIACWDGAQWDALDGGVNGPVNALAVVGTKLYVGGVFNKAGNLDANNIAYWEAGSWQLLGSGSSWPVTALAWWDSKLFAANKSTGPLYYWDNIRQVWDFISAPTGMQSGILSLAAGPDGLYAGGGFFDIHLNSFGQPINYIGRWDGVKWIELGSGIEGENPYYYFSVNTIQPFGSRVFVGGRFNVAGNNMTSGLAAWNTMPELENYRGYNDPIGPISPGSVAYLIGKYFNLGEQQIKLYVNGIDLHTTFTADEDGKVFFHLWFPGNTPEGIYNVTLSGSSGSSSTSIVIDDLAPQFETSYAGKIVLLPIPIDGSNFTINIPLIFR